MIKYINIRARLQEYLDAVKNITDNSLFDYSLDNDIEVETHDSENITRRDR